MPMTIKRLLFILLPVFVLIGNADGQTYKRLTNLPAMYVETFGNRAITSKTTYIYATVHYVDEDDVVTQYDSVQIRGRGNSTWSSMGDKKPYKIKFHDKVKLLGKGYANCKPWTLLANTGDKSLIRNAITSRLCDFLGLSNNPGHKFIDLYLNGVYRGNYMISDHIDVRPHRVNIAEQEYPLTAESDISGGYLLEVDGFHDGNCFASSRNVYIRIHYPEQEVIAASQKNYIRNYVNSFESRLFGSGFTDPVEGYRAMVDSASLINWMLVTEISANIDGYYSTYFYKDQSDPKLYFGPCWDYDIAYDNDTRITPTTKSLMVDVGYGDAKIWVNRMWADPWFARAVCKRYDDAISAGLLDYMYAQIDSLALLLDESQQQNYKKWGINTRRYHEVKLYSSYDQYLQYIKNFLSAHISWLQTAFSSRKPVEPTPPFSPDDYFYHIINKGSGTAFNVLTADTLRGPVCGWADNAGKKTEDWVIRKVGDYYHITNRCGGYALNDPAEKGVTNKQLTLAVPDTLNPRQLWTIYPQGTGGYYNLINKYTTQAANLSGGNKADGTSIISYTSDSKNATSNNRQWRFNRSEPLPEELKPVNGIEAPDAFDYVLAYDPHRQILHFGGDDPSRLTFTVYVVGADGRNVGQFRANQQFSTVGLQRGVYVVTWTCEGNRRSTKLYL